MKTPMPIIDAIERRLRALNKFLVIIGAGVLLVEAALTILNITGRYVFNAPVKPTYEVTSLLMIIVLSLCWPYTANEKGHVRVDVLEVFFPSLMKRVLDILLPIIGLVTFTMIVWGLVKTGMQFHRMGSSTDLLGIPFWPFALLLAFGALLASVVILFQVILTKSRVAKGGS
jgi:TRAP-type C4-dicarboxylate transport system permease small subunit